MILEPRSTTSHQCTYTLSKSQQFCPGEILERPGGASVDVVYAHSMPLHLVAVWFAKPTYSVPRGPSITHLTADRNAFRDVTERPGKISSGPMDEPRHTGLNRKRKECTYNADGDLPCASVSPKPVSHSRIPEHMFLSMDLIRAWRQRRSVRRDAFPRTCNGRPTGREDIARCGRNRSHPGS